MAIPGGLPLPPPPPGRLGCALRRLSRACFARFPSAESGAYSTTRCHASRGPLEIVFPERAHDADVQQRFGVTRVDRQRAVELLERAIGLVHVVVADAEIRAGADVARLDGDRLLVPARGICEALRVEIEVAELEPHRGILRVSFCRLRPARPRATRRAAPPSTAQTSAARSAAGAATRRRGVLLAADDPADENAEKHAGEAEDD